ncbi:prepilin peptidase [Exilibacterium tricleocarpae]|uniref:Prepilin leader peptidase/N-methyltransferase n=1 Tax=Exilibacterium tricleocarpae TaxID=2591008 RepID=A0A545TQH0_9GAMM|nr:A24 family peptidase [Exilibacterium tricleocarpae]TQV79457.1 prepilin peptidase [Exilibacterium tricleocarpae]
METYVIALAVVLGLLVGSFLNVVIIRLPQMMQQSWKQDCCELLELENDPGPRFNLVVPNSTCPHCGHRIKPWENIPVISYLFLKGRCAKCRERISPRYPIIELISGLLCGFVALQMGASVQTALVLVLTWCLITLTVIDIDHQLLPDSITLPLLWLGLLANAQGLFAPLEDALYGAAAGYLVLWSIYWLFKLVTGKEGMGYGDFKLLAALGAWLGWQALPVIIIMSSLVGAVIGIAAILIRGRDKNIPIPFGPYLAIAGWITLMWGDKITTAYFRFMGLAS